MRFATEIGPMTKEFVKALLDEAGVDTAGLSLRIVKRATTANYGGTCFGTVARVPHPKNFGFDWSLFGTSVLHEVQHAIDNRSGEVDHLPLEEWEQRARAAQRVVSYERMRQLAIECRAPHAAEMPEHDEVAALLAREVQKHSKSGGKRRHATENALVLVPAFDAHGKRTKVKWYSGSGHATLYRSEDGRYHVSVWKRSNYVPLKRKSEIWTSWCVSDDMAPEDRQDMPDPLRRPKTLAKLLEWFSSYLGRPVIIRRS